MNFELTASMMCANYGNLEKEVYMDIITYCVVLDKTYVGEERAAL